MLKAYAAPTVNQAANVDFSPLHAILSASWPVQVTLLILVAMSVISWAIILSKKKQLQTINEADGFFLEKFWNAQSLDELHESLDRHSDSAAARVFKSGYQELKKMVGSGLAQNSENQPPLLSGIDNLERAVRKGLDAELAFMESRLGFLATTGSTGPFIGLFGTVWGIMGAFHTIGSTGMASLAVVAPGISEALIATAIGLVAAIPATVAYNHFANRIRRQELELSSFGSDFLNVARRNFFRERP